MASIKGTNVLAPVVPFDTTDLHASHEARYGKGGYRSVADIAERDAIPSPRREAGMLVLTLSDGKVWKLASDLTAWSEFIAGASAGTSVAWADITGRPATFTPSSHTHAIADVTGLQTALDAKQASGSYAAASHTHSAGQVSGLAAVATSGSYGDLTNKPSIPAAYSLPVATSSVLGGVKQGANVTIGGDGTISVSAPVTSLPYSSITGTPSLTTVATSGSYADLTGKPTLGTLATQDGTFSGTSSGVNTGDQTIALTGDVTGSGTGSFAATLSSTGVSAGTYTSVTVDAKGRVTAGSSPTIAYSSLSGVPSTFAPSSHKTSHATGGSDALTASDIGAAATSHAHAASDITSGTIATARLASGTASSGTFLRGDQTWAAAGGSSSASDLTSGTLADARLSEKAAAAINSYLWQTFR